MKTPPLRFRGAGDLSLRDKTIPGQWKEKRFSDFATLRRGLTYTPIDCRKEGVRVLRSSNISEDSFVMAEDDVFVSREAANILPVKNGDILITAANGSSHLVGKHAIVTGIVDGAMVHGGFMLLASTEESDYLQAAMNSPWYRTFVANNMLGGNGALGNLGRAAFDEAVFLAPIDKIERDKIGAFFRSLDELIAARKRAVEKTEALKKSMLQKMFPQGDAAVPEVRFRGFGGEWERKTIEDILTIGNGKDYKHLGYGPIPVYGTGGYMTSVSDWLYDGSSVCIGRKGTIDNPLYLEGRFWTVDTLFYTYNFGMNNPYFVYCLFQTIDWASYNAASGVPSLSKAIINEIQVIIPSDVDEQRKIGEYFRSIDTLIAARQEEVRKLRELKNAFLERMFV